MKRCLSLALGVLLLPSLVAAQKANDAVIVDPNVHRVILENEHVRVFEAKASPGARSPMHSHPPFVFIGLDTARVKFGLPDGKSTIFDINPGQVVWLADGMQHSWELLAGNIHVIAVEIKSALKGTAPPAVKRKASDSVTVDPATHNVLFENDHVRVFDGRASAGNKSPMHSHPPTLLVSLGTGRFQLSLPDGQKVLHDWHPGLVMWMGEGMEHSWESLAGEAHVIAIEVKSAHQSAPPKAD